MKPIDSTPANNLKLIDTDVHNAVELPDLLPHMSEYWRDWSQRHGTGSAVAGYKSPVPISREDALPPDGGPPGSDPKFLAEHHLDKYGIGYAILTGSGTLGVSLQPQVDWANSTAAAYNDVLVEKWLDADARFRGSILINHSDPQWSAGEIDRVAADKRFVQVLMASGANRLFGQRFYYPIYEAAERNGLPVAIHPGTEGGGNACPPTPAGYPSRYMEWHNILPINYMATVNSLVCEGVFDKYPGLKFVAIEGGIAWLPHLMWRMDKNYKALRDTTPWLKKLPSEYIREHIRLTTQPIEEPKNPEHILQIFEMMDANNTVMFSSDYPHWDFDNPKMALPPLKGELKENILWKNAARLYKLGGETRATSSQIATPPRTPARTASAAQRLSSAAPGSAARHEWSL